MTPHLGGTEYYLRLSQSEMIKDYKVEIPVLVSEDMDELTIRCPKKLEKDMIKYVCETAIESVIYCHYGFGRPIYSEDRRNALAARFKVLDENKVYFKALALVISGHLNVEYPSCFSDSCLRPKKSNAESKEADDKGKV